MTEQQNQKPLLETRLVPMAERTSAQVERGQPKYHRDINPADSLVALSFLGDVLIIILGLCLGYWIKFRSGWITFGVEAPNIIFTDYVGLISLGTLFLLSTFGFLKLYDSRKLLRYRQQGVLILKGSTFWLFAYLGTSLALKFDPPISRIYVLSSWICVLVSLIIWRWLFHQLIKIETVSASLRQRILFIGWNQDALRFAEAVNKDRSRPYKVVGCGLY
jgi:FlaA1/EpsC-like NDP-sugar epimerase